jgi:O-antigen/teichoic acid export membrane protein
MFFNYKKIFAVSKYKDMITHFSEYLQKKQFLKNFLTLVSGNILAQIVTVAAIPIVTRIYSPAEFGLFALFMAINSSISVICCLTYERAILLPESEEDTFNVILLSFLVLTGISTILFVIVLIFNSELALLFKNRDIGFWLYFIPLAVFLFGLIRISTLCRLKYKYFKIMSASKIIRALSSATVKIGLCISLTAYGGWLILAELISEALCFLTLVRRPSSQIIRSFLDKISRKGLRKVALEYRKFPIYLSWAALLNFFTKNSVFFVLSIFFTPAIVGYYALCNRALGLPLELISGSMQNVYLQKSTSQIKSGQPIFSHLARLVLVLSVLAILPTIILILFGNHIFVFVFGDKWYVAGQYIQVMTPWFFFLFISSPSKVIFVICQKQELRLIFNIIIAVSRVSSLIVSSFMFDDPLKVITFFIIVNCLLEFIEIVLTFSIARKSDLNLQIQSH